MQEITANVPIEVRGYGLPLAPGDTTPTTREYYILGRCIAGAKVMYYEGKPRFSAVGFLLDGKLYQEIEDLDEAVSEIAAVRLLEDWGK